LITRNLAMMLLVMTAACATARRDGPPGEVVDAGSLSSDEAPKLIKGAKPVYPDDAYAKRIEGTVMLQILIDTQGRVADVKVVKSIPELDAAAVATVRRWRFTPARKNGQPVAAVAMAPVMFKLY